MIPQRVRERFWSRVDRTDIGGCWPWTMSCGSHGYGQIGWRTDGKVHTALAHRVAYMLEVGPIPDGLTVDHLCRQRRCCNPRHLQLLTNIENARNNGQSARTHCPQGHPYSGDNLHWAPPSNPNGGLTRRCQACARDQARRQSLRKKQISFTQPNTQGAPS